MGKCCTNRFSGGRAIGPFTSTPPGTFWRSPADSLRLPWQSIYSVPNVPLLQCCPTNAVIVPRFCCKCKCLSGCRC
jgi:hypothetical protein